MIKKLILTVAFLVVVVGALVSTKLDQFKIMGEVGSKMVPPPEVVTAAQTEPGEWERTLLSTGTLTPVQGVTVAAETPGKITRISFSSGISVKAGDVLVQLETTTEEAQLRAAKAAAELARANLSRTRELRKNLTISPAELDAAKAKYDEAQAQAESIRTSIAKQTIRAPFTGRLGMRQVNLGEVLKEGDAVTSLQSLDPIYVDFSLPQQQLPLLTLGMSIRVTSDAAPDEIFAGEISAISPQIDPVTRSVRLQGTITNEDETLRGGMFANVQVVLPARETVLAIPLTAVLFAPFGDSVFVIESPPIEGSDKSTLMLRQRFVRLGTRRGDFVAVTAGLKAGEQVVSSGVFKLRSGMTAVIDNSLAPDAKLLPKPDNS
ncbi:MAG: membrane fusion protein (multidrug efflux system) [Gammaproteobacteria bacterium]|jgi:membrane fusion protein (multidrug efflux system)